MLRVSQSNCLPLWIPTEGVVWPSNPMQLIAAIPVRQKMPPENELGGIKNAERVCL